MGSFLTHSFDFIFYYLFPGRFNLAALLIGAYIIDAEYLFMFLNNFFFKKKNFIASSNLTTGFLHSLVGCAIVCLPVTVLLTYLIQPSVFDLSIVVFSAVVGLLSHLIIDIPGHTNLMLFWPFIKIDKNPIVFFKNIKWFEKLKLYCYHEEYPGQLLPYVNYLMISHIFLVASIVVYLLIR